MKKSRITKKTGKKVVSKRKLIAKVRKTNQEKNTSTMSQFKTSMLSLISETSNQSPAADIRRALKWAI